MLFSVSDDRELINTAELQFRCSACNVESTTDALRFKTTSKRMGVLTVWVTHETAVKCPACLATFRSTATLEELSELSAGQIAGRFRLRIGLIEKFLVVAGWLMVFVAPVSCAMFLIAWFTVPTATRGWRRATTTGLVVSALLSIIWFARML